MSFLKPLLWYSWKNPTTTRKLFSQKISQFSYSLTFLSTQTNHKPLKSQNENDTTSGGGSKDSSSILVVPEHKKEQSVDLKRQQGIQEMYEEALRHPDYFGVARLFTVEHLFDCRVHLGHKTGTLNDHMRPYIFGSRLDHLIFDLDLTAACLRDALNFIAHMTYRQSITLFCNRHRENIYLVEKTAADSGEYSFCRPHTAFMTNSDFIFGGTIRLPDLVIFLNTKSSTQDLSLIVRDSARMLIPSVGVVDTDCDPTLITYPIPGNDESPAAVALYCKLFKTVILEAKKRRLKDLKARGLSEE